MVVLWMSKLKLPSVSQLMTRSPTISRSCGSIQLDCDFSEVIESKLRAVYSEHQKIKPCLAQIPQILIAHKLYLRKRKTWDFRLFLIRLAPHAHRHKSDEKSHLQKTSNAIFTLIWYKDLGKPLIRKCCLNGILSNSFWTSPFGLLFSPKISQFFKTAVLTIWMDILTMTMIKHYSLMVFWSLDIMVDNGEIWFSVSVMVYIH